MDTPDNRERADKGSLHGQRGVCVWMTGLSGSGKSTIGASLQRELHQRGRLCMVLDGDQVRKGLNRDLGFSDADRTENIRRVAEVAKLFVQQDFVVVCCFISPTRAIRGLAKDIVGAGDVVEVFIDTPMDECERRDVKGLYAKARAQEVMDFTGISAPFEIPSDPALAIRTTGRTVEDCSHELLDFILPRIAGS